MSSLPKYEGFRNYPTWCVNIWLQNGEPSYRYWTSRAREILSQVRKVVPGEGVYYKAKVALATEIQGTIEGDTSELNGMYATC